MGRPIWKGSISFGLVQIPVALHSAEQRHELSFTLLDRRDLGPVGYERINRRSGQKVAWKDIVKGYPYRKGKYVVVTDEDIRHANVRATGTIDIEAFVDRERISSLYFDTPYYLAPTQSNGKAYAVLRDTLQTSGKVGIAKIVIRTRQHLAALLAEGDVLVLQLLRFANELKSPDELEVPGHDKSSKPTARELEMAQHLVASMSEDWDPTRYHDAYRDDLLARIKQKAQHGEIEDAPASKETAPSATNVIDLLEVLKRSVRTHEGEGRGRANNADKKKGAAVRAKALSPRSRATRKAPTRKSA